MNDDCLFIYEVCSENNGNFLISRVWRVLLSIFFFFYVGIHAPEAAAKVRRVFMSSAIFVC